MYYENGRNTHDINYSIILLIVPVQLSTFVYNQNVNHINFASNNEMRRKLGLLAALLNQHAFMISATVSGHS